MANADWRADAAAWWLGSAWHAYEALHDGPPGTRATLLAEVTWQTRIVDLSLSEADLWRGVRKSYHAIINKTDRELKIEAIPQGEAGGLISTCQRVHRLGAGRQTRPDGTWDLMGDWADAGRGMIVMAFDYEHEMTEPGGFNGFGPGSRWPSCVAFAYLIVNSSWAYYASGRSLKKDVQHAVIWRALLALKTRGVRWVELGWQGQATGEKGKNVEWFKTGFGGCDEPARLAASVEVSS